MMIQLQKNKLAFLGDTWKMIIIITGASHTGKTLLAQKILEEKQWPYFSIDHLKMGLIRSGNTDLTPGHEAELVEYLWPIVREMIKTAIENHQNLIIEGCYVPFDWQSDFDNEYLKEIKYICLIMSKDYILNHFDEIKTHANEIECRVDDSYCKADWLIKNNTYNLEMCQKNGLQYVFINDKYDFAIDII